MCDQETLFIMKLSSSRDPVGDTSGSFFYPIRTMNIQLKLNPVQLAELKEIMRKDKRTFNEQGVKKYVTDLMHRHYIKCF